MFPSFLLALLKGTWLHGADVARLTGVLGHLPIEVAMVELLVKLTLLEESSLSGLLILSSTLLVKLS